MLSKTAEYALRAIIYIALGQASGKKIGIKEIAKELDLPMHFIGKILQNIVRQGLLASIKGPNGGFYLGKNGDQVTIMDVINVVDGPEVFRKCGLGLQDCSDIHPCPLHNDFKQFREGIKAVFCKKTIKDLVLSIESGEGFIINLKLSA